MNTAKKIAEMFDNDGERFTSLTGVSLGTACSDAGAKKERSPQGDTRWTFEDGSIITSNRFAWDFGYGCCWGWSGAGNSHSADCAEYDNG